MNLDFMIMASSRPKLLKIMFKSFKKNLICDNTNIRFIMHEDFVFPEQSEQSVKFARLNNIDVIRSVPKIGVGRAMDKMFKKVETDYLFACQDDWELERPIELDRLLWVMERNHEINCVTFNKYRNMKPGHHEGFNDKDYYFDGLPLTIYPGWQFLPGVWRMSKVREKWRVRENRPEGYYQNAFGTHDQRTDRNFCKKNIGAYMYGPLGDYRYVTHIGGTWRMADWQLKNGKTSGVKHWDFMYTLERDRAPWLKQLEPRPMNPDVKLTEEGKKILKTKSDNIRKIFSDKI